MKKLVTLGLLASICANGAAQSPFLDARGNTSLLLPSGGYLQVAFDQTRATFGFSRNNSQGLFHGLELSARQSGDKANLFSEGRLSDNVTLKFTIGQELQSFLYAREASLQTQLAAARLDVALRNGYIDDLKNIKAGAEGVLKAERSRKRTNNEALLAQLEADKKKAGENYAKAVQTLESDFLKKRYGVLVKAPFTPESALGGLRSSDYREVSKAVDLLLGQQTGSRSECVDNLKAIKASADAVLDFEDKLKLANAAADDTEVAKRDKAALIIRTREEVQKAKEAYDDSVANLELGFKRGVWLQGDVYGPFLKEPLTPETVLSALRSKNYKNASETLGALIEQQSVELKQEGQQQEILASREAAVSGLVSQIENLTDKFDKIALVFTGTTAKYTLYDGEDDFSNQFKKRSFEGWGVTLNYNLLIPSARFGLAVGIERSNNIDDLDQKEFTDVTTVTSGDVTRTTEKKTKAYVGDYRTLDRAPLRADAVWWPTQFKGQLALTTYIRGDLRRLDDTFAPGLGLFLAKKGAPTSVIGGLTVLFPKGKAEVAIVAGYSF